MQPHKLFYPLRLFWTCKPPIYVLQTAQSLDAEKMLYNLEEERRGVDGAKNNATQQAATIKYAWQDVCYPTGSAEKP